MMGREVILEYTSTGPFNVILRFANTTFFWLLISYGQYLLKYLVGICIHTYIGTI